MKTSRVASKFPDSCTLCTRQRRGWTSVLSDLGVSQMRFVEWVTEWDWRRNRVLGKREIKRFVIQKRLIGQDTLRWTRLNVEFTAELDYVESWNLLIMYVQSCFLNLRSVIKFVLQFWMKPFNVWEAFAFNRFSSGLNIVQSPYITVNLFHQVY